MTRRRIIKTMEELTNMETTKEVTAEENVVVEETTQPIEILEETVKVAEEVIQPVVEEKIVIEETVQPIETIEETVKVEENITVEEVIQPVVEETVVEKKVISKEAAKAIATSKFRYIDDYFSSYQKSLKSFNSVDAIKNLSGLYMNLANKGTKEHFDYTLNIFTKNRDTILNPTRALTGIQTLPNTIRVKIGLMHSIFFHIAKKFTTKVNFDLIRKETKNEELVNWVQSKLRKNK